MEHNNDFNEKLREKNDQREAIEIEKCSANWMLTS